MAIINEELKNIKGFCCYHCEKFYTYEEIKRTYTVEAIGNTYNIIKEEKTCPECGHYSDLEEFTPEEWTSLAGLIKARYRHNVWIKVPIYNSDNDIFPVAYKTVSTVEEVEELAGRYCIEVVKATIDEFDLMDVEVDFG